LHKLLHCFQILLEIIFTLIEKLRCFQNLLPGKQVFCDRDLFLQSVVQLRKIFESVSDLKENNKSDKIAKSLRCWHKKKHKTLQSSPCCCTTLESQNTRHSRRSRTLELRFWSIVETFCEKLFINKSPAAVEPARPRQPSRQFRSCNLFARTLFTSFSYKVYNKQQ
jgi:hypothetical protein